MSQARLRHPLVGPLALVAVVLVTLTAAGPAPAEEIHEVGGDVEPPRRIEGGYPAYPPQAKEEGIEGRVVVRTVIDAEGRVGDVEVISSPGPSFDQAVREALEIWRFEPARLGGEPVSVHYHLTFNFRLDKDEEAGAESPESEGAGGAQVDR